MKKAEIEQRFGAAMRYVKTLHRRGFQARVSEAVGIQSSNLSEIITKDKGTFEETRRAIFTVCAELTPQLEGISYDSFLYLGELLLSGVPGEEALEQARRTVFGVGNVTLPGIKIRGEATNTPPEPPSNSGTVRQVVEDQGTPTFMTVYDYSKGRLTQVETNERLHKLRDGVYMVERDDPFDSLTGPAMDSLRDWWRKKHGDTHNSAAQFVMELGRRFPEMSPVVQITGDKPPGGGQGK